MIAFFRRTLASKLALGLLALVMLAFLLTGVFTREMPGTSGLGGASGDVAARAGDRRVTVPEMDERVRRTFAQYQQQQPGLDLPRFVATGGFDAVVDQTIGAAALEAFARRIGLAASKRQVDGEIAGIQAFQGPNGKFDPQAFRAALAQQHIAEPDLRRDIGGDILRRMLYLPASGAVTVPDGLIRPYAGLVAETRSGAIGLVPAAAFASGPAPGDAELKAFLAAHAAAYMLPERRVLRYALIGRQQVAGAAVPNEAEIRRAYDAKAQKYAARETRALSQVVLDSQAKAQAFVGQVKGGKGFAEAAKAAGFGAADIAIGDKTQAQFAGQASPAVAAAAFAAPDGGITPPVKSDFGWHVVKVDKVVRTAGTGFEAARPQIAADLIKQKQDTALAALTAKAQDQLDGGQGLADVAKANGLAVSETPPVTVGGAAPGDAAYKAPPELASLLKPGFATAPDQAPTLETIQQGERYALLSVARVLPAAPLPFAQVRGRLAADYAAVRASDRAKAAAQAIVAKVKGGTAMADAFKAAPVTLPTPQAGSGRRIDLSRARGQVPASLKALFTMPAGGTKLVPADGGQGWYVVQLQKIVPADAKLLPPLVAASRGELVQATGDEYAQQLANAAAAAVGTSRNEAALAELKRRLLGIAPATP
ncbi:SurA N-terminal domain-containing protein [Sphingomonas sp.]|uniref:SurA N-terminal domain-containing protein n=1 Tax=Sphingomonas sp. TaxID=28214 RepID=UPI003B001AFA